MHDDATYKLGEKWHSNMISKKRGALQGDNVTHSLNRKPHSYEVSGVLLTAQLHALAEGENSTSTWSAKCSPAT